MGRLMDIHPLSGVNREEIGDAVASLVSNWEGWGLFLLRLHEAKEKSAPLSGEEQEACIREAGGEALYASVLRRLRGCWTTWGPVRGGCGHAHKSVLVAVDCINRDRDRCSRRREHCDRELRWCRSSSVVKENSPGIEQMIPDCYRCYNPGGGRRRLRIRT